MNMANAKFKIKGKGNIPNYDTDLDIEVDDKYEAYSKPVPDPTPFENGFITWFNAFGVKEKATGKDANIRYHVTLQALPAGKRLFYLYNNQPHEITVADAGNGKVKYTLDIGDPPTGTYP
jgi:hypothetical protein